MNKNLLDLTRELGKSIQLSDDYQDFLFKEQTYKNDSKAIKIKELLDKKINIYNNSLEKISTKRAEELKLEIQSLKKTLNNQKTYSQYINSKNNINNLIKNIDNIIEFYTGMSKNNNKCKGCNGCNK